MGIKKWWDKSIWNRRVFLGPKLLYHGTTKKYYTKELFDFEHSRQGAESKDSSIWFEKNPVKAVKWAVYFAVKFKDKPVLVIVSRKGISNLRRNWLHFGKFSGAGNTFWRGDRIDKSYAEMIELKFTSKYLFEAWWGNLTKKCKEEITEAQADLI